MVFTSMKAALSSDVTVFAASSSNIKSSSLQQWNRGVRRHYTLLLGQREWVCMAPARSDHLVRLARGEMRRAPSDPSSGSADALWKVALESCQPAAKHSLVQAPGKLLLQRGQTVAHRLPSEPLFRRPPTRSSHCAWLPTATVVRPQRSNAGRGMRRLHLGSARGAQEFRSVVKTSRFPFPCPSRRPHQQLIT